jgi:error-prone DNA polymerase
MLPIDINYFEWDNKLESKSGKYYALRLGFRQIKGIREEELRILVEKRRSTYVSVNELREIGLSEITLEKLADADAFRRWGMTDEEHYGKSLPGIILNHSFLLYPKRRQRNR